MLQCKSAVCHVSVVSVVLASVVMMVSNVVQCVRSIPVSAVSLLTLSHDAKHSPATSAQKSAQVRQVCREVPRATVGGALSGQLH